MEFISDVARHLVDATGLQRGFPLVHTVQHRIELRPVGKRVHQGTEGTVEGGHITHAKTQEQEKENCDLVHFFEVAPDISSPTPNLSTPGNEILLITDLFIGRETSTTPLITVDSRLHYLGVT